MVLTILLADSLFGKGQPHFATTKKGFSLVGPLHLFLTAVLHYRFQKELLATFQGQRLQESAASKFTFECKKANGMP